MILCPSNIQHRENSLCMLLCIFTAYVASALCCIYCVGQVLCIRGFTRFTSITLMLRSNTKLVYSHCIVSQYFYLLYAGVKNKSVIPHTFFALWGKSSCASIFHKAALL